MALLQEAGALFRTLDRPDRLAVVAFWEDRIESKLPFEPRDPSAQPTKTDRLGRGHQPVGGSILSPSESIEAFRSGRALEERGDRERALAAYADAAEGLRSAENLSMLALAQAQRGGLLVKCGERRLAVDCLLEAEGLLVRTGDPDGVELVRSLLEAVGVNSFKEAADPFGADHGVHRRVAPRAP